MEQIWLIIAEHAGIVFMGYCILTMILLAVTLHTIRKNEKQTKRLAEVVERTLLQVKPSTESNQTEQEGAELEAVPSVKETLQQEELLNAVLGEVFPEAALR